MIFFFNLRGVALGVLLIIGWGIGSGGDWLPRILSLVVMAVPVVIDIRYRLKDDSHGFGLFWKLISPRTGGHLAFLPIWLIGIFFALGMLSLGVIELLIILVIIIILLFSVGRIANIGRDLGSALRGFREGLAGDDPKKKKEEEKKE